MNWAEKHQKLIALANSSSYPAEVTAARKKAIKIWERHLSGNAQTSFEWGDEVPIFKTEFRFSFGVRSFDKANFARHMNGVT